MSGRMAEAVRLGAGEALVRVSKYGPDLATPEQWQALVKHRQRDKVWGVGLHADPEQAMVLAVESFVARHTPKPTRTRVRAPAQPPARTRVRTRVKA